MIFLLLAFLLGSVPFGSLVKRLFHARNPQSFRGGNASSMDVRSVANYWPVGFLIFILDLAKGSIPVFLGSIEAADRLLIPIHLGPNAAWSGALFAVLGHCFSPWLRFRGGKGVATGFGALILLAPLPALVGFLVALMIFLRRRIVSLSCINGVVAASVSCVVLGPVEAHLFFGALMVAVILARHEENIDALLTGNEPQFR